MSTRKENCTAKIFKTEPKEIFDTKNWILQFFVSYFSATHGGNLCMKVTSTRSTWQNLSRICKKAEDGIKQSQMQSFQSNQSPNSKFDGELNVIIH